MDKLKVGLDAFKRYNFWVLLVVMVLVACGAWFVATADIVDDYEDRVSTLDSKFSALTSTAGKPDLPNDQRIEFINEKHGVLKEKVYQAWGMLKKMQEEKNKLPGPISDEFKRQFNRYLDSGIKIDRKYLEEYQFFVLDHFPALFDAIGIRRPADGEATEPGATEKAAPVYGARDADGAGDEEIKMVGVVDWREEDRERVQQRFFWEKRPTTDEVVLAQEDLWVYEALLRAIKNTNGAATDQYNAPITVIEALEIGSQASNAWMESAELIMAGVAGVQGSGEAEPGDTEQSGEGGLNEGDYSSYHGSSSAADQIRQYRYVGLNGKPLGAKQNHPYAEFKMMPIRMSLVMDQTTIPKLLVACANSNMPIEIRKVRLYPGKAAKLDLTPKKDKPGAPADGASSGTGFSATSGGGGGVLHSGPSYGGGYGGYGGYSSSHGGRGGYSSGSAGASSPQPGEQPLHAPVELQGVIYIFNPPDKAKLGTGSAAEEPAQPPVETPPAETPPAETPPAETAPGATPPDGTTPPKTPAVVTPPDGDPVEGAPTNNSPPAKAAASRPAAANP